MTCDDVRQLLHSVVQFGFLPALPEDAIDHIAACAECRGATLLLATTVAETSPLNAIGCADCQEHLAAYIDQELEAGAKAAAKSYPQIWRHLWLCASCAETYQLTHALATATKAGDIPPPPLW